MHLFCCLWKLEFYSNQKIFFVSQKEKRKFKSWCNKSQYQTKAHHFQYSVCGLIKYMFRKLATASTKRSERRSFVIYYRKHTKLQFVCGIGQGLWSCWLLFDRTYAVNKQTNKRRKKKERKKSEQKTFGQRNVKQTNKQTNTLLARTLYKTYWLHILNIL